MGRVYHSPTLKVPSRDSSLLSSLRTRFRSIPASSRVGERTNFVTGPPHKQLLADGRGCYDSTTSSLSAFLVQVPLMKMSPLALLSSLLFVVPTTSPAADSHADPDPAAIRLITAKEIGGHMRFL